MNLMVFVCALIVAIFNCFNSFVGAYVPIVEEEIEVVEVIPVEVPILMFHHFVLKEKDCNNSGAIITKEKFEEVLDDVEEMGYTTISFEELIAYTEKKGELPDKPILITMDDGYMSNYEIAYPILKEKNMKALVSIIGKSTKYKSSYIENKSLPHVGWEQLNEMIKSGVFEVGNHTFDLHKLKTTGGKRNGIIKNFLETESNYAKVISNDISRLEEELKINCNYENSIFCYPYGFYDELSEAIISSLGYKVTLTVDEGINYITPDDDLIGLKRINVDMKTDIKKKIEDLK